MISSLLKKIMKECDLQQAGLAEVMEVSLDRVKSLTSGKVRNLKREESEALIGKLGIRAEWLVTGEGSMRGGESLRSEGQRTTSTNLDVELLAEAITAVEKLVAHRGRSLSPAKKAQVIVQIYLALTSGQGGAAVSEVLAQVG